MQFTEASLSGVCPLSKITEVMKKKKKRGHGYDNAQRDNCILRAVCDRFLVVPIQSAQ